MSPLLRRLHISGLERSPRLQRDLISLLPPSCLQTLGFLEGSRIEIDTRGKDDVPRRLSHELTKFVTHIHEAIRIKPHLYLSYTWVLYMAIFSGGRYVRAKLESAGLDFWTNTSVVESSKNDHSEGGTEAEKPEKWPLSFWNFSGTSDGEDVRADYKSRVRETERILTVKEREEIINEAAEIMKSLLRIIREIEVAVAEGAVERIIDSEMCESHTAGINLTPRLKDDFYVSRSGIPATGSPSLCTLLCKHLLPLGIIDLAAGITNLFFSARRGTKVPAHVPVQLDRGLSGSSCDRYRALCYSSRRSWLSFTWENPQIRE